MLREIAILSILEAMGCGGLVLDTDGRVLHTNEKARRYLNAELEVRQRGGPAGDKVGHEKIQIALRRAIKASTDVIPQLGNYMMVPRGTQRPLLLRRIILPDETGSNSGATAAIVVLDMEECPFPDEDLLREVFLLTAAEIRLAQRLSRGIPA